MRLLRISLLLVLGVCHASAEDALLDWMNRIAQQQLAAREAAIAQIRTPADAARRRQLVHDKLMEIIGGLPDYRGPLNARVTGTLTNPDYTLDKVIFESLPHYYVTANLYRPNRPGRFPRGADVSRPHHAWQDREPQNGGKPCREGLRCTVVRSRRPGRKNAGIRPPGRWWNRWLLRK